MTITKERTRARAVRPAGWSIARKTPYSQCDQCGALCTPILEVVFRATSKTRYPQWHYLCEECAQCVCNGTQAVYQCREERLVDRRKRAGLPDAPHATRPTPPGTLEALEQYRNLTWGTWRPPGWSK